MLPSKSRSAQCRKVLRTARPVDATGLIAAVFFTLCVLLWPIPILAQDGACLTLPDGSKFCRPQPVSEMTQCVRNMQRYPKRSVAEACRLGFVSSCRTLSDEQFEHRYAVRRPRLIDARATERTPGWNRHCPASLGYRYTPLRASNRVAGTNTTILSNPDQERSEAIEQAGGNEFLIEPFDATALVSLPNAGPCLCDDGTKPVFGFCSADTGTYKPACAQN